MANIYWVGGTGTWNTSSTTNWANASGGTGGTGTVPTAADNVFFDQAGTYTVTLTGALLCSNITVSAGTVTFTSTGALTVSGSMSLASGTAWGATAVITFNSNGAQTITAASTTFNCSLTFNGVGGSWQLLSAVTTGSTRTVTLTNGTLNLNNNNLTCGLFSSSNANTRTIAFGTSGIYITGNNGQQWVTDNLTGLSLTGTPNVYLTYSGSVGTRSVYCGLQSNGGYSESNTPNFYVTGGSDTVRFLGTFRTYGTIDLSGFTGQWSSDNWAFTMYGNLVVSSVNTLNTSSSFSGPITFAGVQGTKTINTGGLALNVGTTFNGVGGYYQLQSNLATNTGNTVTLTNGTLDLNNKNLTCGLFSSTNSNTRSLVLGSSTVTLTGASGTIWNCTTATNMTLSAGTSSIVSTSQTGQQNFYGGGLTYYNLTCNGPNNATNQPGSFITGANTFNNLTLGPIVGIAARYDYNISNDQYVTGTFTLGGTDYTHRVMINGNTNSKGYTNINAASVSLNYADFRCITALGSAIPWSGTNLSNQGSNTNITFPAAKTVYWNSTAGGNWSDNSWATASGGTPAAANFPLAQDTVFLDNTGLSNGSTLVISAVWAVGRVDCSALTNTATISTTTTTGLDFCGNVTLAPGLTLSGVGFFYVNGIGTTINTAGASIAWQVYTQPELGGTVTLLSDLSTTGTAVNIYQGNLNLNGHTITANQISIWQAQTAFVNTVTFNGGSLVCNSNVVIAGAGSGSFNSVAGSAAGTIYMTSAGNKTFAGGSYSYAATLVQAGAGALTVTGNNTFYNITNTAQAPVINFTGGNTTTLTNGFNLNGTLGFPVTLNSTNTAPFTLSLSTGTVNARYMNLSYSTATGGATWNAINSTDSGNNTGWNFTSAPQQVSFGGGITIGTGISFS